MIDTSARLIAVSYVGEFGVAQRVETQTPILCSISSVNRTEFYAAFNSGFRPEWRVETQPVNYAGETMIEIDTPEGPVRCDVYRTYRKALDVLELWCSRQNEAAVQAFTLFTGGRRVVLHGAYLTGSDSVNREPTGDVATDLVTLILPQTLQAFLGETPAAYCRPKEFARMSPADQAEHFTIDDKSFFVIGEIDPTLLFAPQFTDGVLGTDGRLFGTSDIPSGAKYQQINAIWDDVYLVQTVSLKNKGKPGTEYIEVIGR